MLSRRRPVQHVPAQLRNAMEFVVALLGGGDEWWRPQLPVELAGGLRADQSPTLVLAAPRRQPDTWDRLKAAARAERLRAILVTVGLTPGDLVHLHIGQMRRHFVEHLECGLWTFADRWFAVDEGQAVSIELNQGGTTIFDALPWSTEEERFRGLRDADRIARRMIWSL